jgi:hypothetical protein
MAFLIKNQQPRQNTSASKQGYATVDQWIQVTQPAVALPATTTGQIFRVKGGRVLVKSLVGEVTTVIQTQADNLKVTSKKLDSASVAVGTAKDIAADVNITALEVGSLYFVEGDGTAGVLSTAGGAYIGPNSGMWIAPQGEIYLTTSATNTGAMKWDIWYQPLDPGAYVEPAALTAGILTAAI